MEESKQKEYLSYLCGMGQKLTRAVYRVTDMMPDQEPLKWKLREKSVALFTDLSYIKDKEYLERLSRLSDIETFIDEVILLLSLVEDENTISGTNFQILKDEYRAIKKFIENERGSNLFEEIFLKKGLEAPKESIGQSAIGQSNGQDDNVRLNNNLNKDNENNDNQFSWNKTNKEKETKRKKPVKINKVQSQSTKERKSKVFETVKERGRVSVGEISSLFSDFSEKTIQRDLLEMVKSGILKKEGDKRWRTYVFDKI